jgi:hypothetical protein
MAITFTRLTNTFAAGVHGDPVAYGPPFWIENRPKNSCRKSKSGSWTSSEVPGGRNRNFLFE